MQEPKKRLLRRAEASKYIFETHNCSYSSGALATLASMGGGPIFIKIGRIPFYASDDLDAWIKEKSSPRVRSTSELSAA